MNIFILALLVLSITIATVCSLQILSVLFTGRHFKGEYGFRLNVFWLIVFATLAFWLPQFL